MLMINAVKKFYRRCVAMNVSTRTIDTYRYQIKRFILMTGISDLSDVTRDTMYKLFADMREKGYAPDTIRGEYVALHTMFNFLYEEGDIDFNPMDGIKKPKLPKVYARTFTVEEMTRILGFYANKSDEISIRNHAIISLLFGTGIRKGELLRLTVLDIHLDESYVTVNGKGNKQRIIPLTQSIKRSLKRYLGVRHSNVCPFLFITRDGSAIKDGCLREVFRRLKEELGMSGKRFSPHTIRHTFAKMFLLNGGDLFALQKILGHEDISTTKMYVDYTEKEMNVQMQQCSPLENHRWTYF